MPVYAFKGCRLDTAGPLRDHLGNEVQVDVSAGGIYTVQVVPSGGSLFTTAVLEVMKFNAIGTPRKALSTSVTFTSTLSTHLTEALSPEAAMIGLDVTTGEASKNVDVYIWHLPADPVTVGP